jgi:hypothetical protein
MAPYIATLHVNALPLKKSATGYEECVRLNGIWLKMVLKEYHRNS